MLIINKAFLERAYTVFNPRNSFYISKIDGKLNNDLLVQRDTVINANTFMYLGRSNYDEERMTLTGEKSHIRYSIGDKVVVKVVRASKEDKTIDFEIVKKV